MRLRVSRALFRMESNPVVHAATLALVVLAGACATSGGSVMTEAASTSGGEACQVEVWNDNSVAIRAWYDPGQNQVGTIPPHESVVIRTACDQGRILVRAEEVDGQRSASASVLLESGETKLAQLSLSGI